MFIAGTRKEGLLKFDDLRVAIIVPRLAHLGPVIVIQNLANFLCNVTDLRVKLFYIHKRADESMNIDMLVNVEKLNWSKFPFYDFDIVHTNGFRPDLFAYCKRRKIKYHISTIHNFVFDDLKFTYGKIASYLFGNIWLMLWKRADKLVCVSDALKKYYSQWFSSENLKVIHNGIMDTDRSDNPDPGITDVIEKYRMKGLRVIGSVGILNRRKGIDQLLHLLSVELEYALVVIGDGKERTALQKLSKRFNVSDRSCFCGFSKSAIDYYQYFDVFVMPSRSEGFGLALIEAVQQKVPVICSDIEVFRELFNPDEVTFFKNDSIVSLRAALQIARETGTTKIEPAYVKYKKQYMSCLMAQKYLDLYQSA